MRGGPAIHKLLLYYPVTNACFNTPTYCQFAVDYYLYREGMKWFWDQYTACMEDRNQIMASPLRASEERLKNFPDKLRCAGVAVTAVLVPRTIHDFVMLNALDQTYACRMAMDMSVTWMNT